MFDLETTQFKRAPQSYAHFAHFRIAAQLLYWSLDGVAVE
jgi:hypothetical protein